MKKLVLLGIVLLLLMLSVVPVSAAQHPSSMSVVSSHAFRNYAETGDLLVLVEYKIMYDGSTGNIPDTYNSTTQEDEFAAASTTEIQLIENFGTGSPVVIGRKPNYHFGHSFNSIYFTPAEVIAKGISWPGTGLGVKVVGKVSEFSPNDLDGITMATQPLSSASLCGVDSITPECDWVDGNHYTDTTDIYQKMTNRKVGLRVMTIMENIGSTYPPDAANGVPAYTQSKTARVSQAGTRVLTRLGSEYVIDILPGLSKARPGADFFQVQVISAVNVPTTQGTEYDENLRGHLTSTMEDNFETMGLAAFGKTGLGYVVGGLGFILIALSILGMIFNVTSAVLPAMVLGVPLSIAGSMLGMIPLALVFIVFFFVIVIFSFTFLTQKAG